MIVILHYISLQGGNELAENEDLMNHIPEDAKSSVMEAGLFIGTPTAIGATVGSFVPVIGTGIGAGVGAVIGSVAFLSKKIKEKMNS